MQKILVVEPDAQLSNIMRTHLEKRYNVVICNDAQTAIIAADDRRPHAVVLELAIPEHNGIAFLQEFRSYNDWRKIPIVVYSHVPIEDTGIDLSGWKKMGVAEYLYKSTAKLADIDNAIASSLASSS